MHRTILLAITLTGWLLVNCAGEPARNPQPVETVPSAAAVATQPVAPQPTATAAPVHTATSVPPTHTPRPTSTPSPFLRITATPTAESQTAGFVSYGMVVQPAYAASDCSDKYPCNEDVAAWEARIQVPEGFTAAYYAHLAGQQPTALAFGPDGLLYVATQGGTIFSVAENGTYTPFVAGLIAPTGLAFRPGSDQLYVSSRVREQNAGGEAQVSVVIEGELQPIIRGLPCCYAFMHGPHGIAFDSQGWGYVGVGAKADHGEILGTPNEQAHLDPLEAGILRFSPDGSAVKKYAEGLRNPYGIAIDAQDQLFAVDNGPDYGPPDEFHRIVPGANHGYPWYACDACFPKPAGVEVLPPTHTFPPHSAPTGLTAYLVDQFPNAYNNLFAVLWSAFPEAQRVVRFGPNGEEMETFATGFAAPIDAAVGPNGSLYVADWATGIIFKISYTGNQ